MNPPTSVGLAGLIDTPLGGLWRNMPGGALVLSIITLAITCRMAAQTASASEFTFLTLAGPPASSGPGADDGPGAVARFNSPYAVAVDGDGKIYVADSHNQVIRKIETNGVVTTLAGLAGQKGSADGPGSVARFNEPRGIEADGEGNLYVADRVNSTIRRITPRGEVTTLAGSAGQRGAADGKGDQARFFYPTGVGVDQTGNVYVSDTMNHAIRKVAPDGQVTTLAGRLGVPGSSDGMGTNAWFNQPAGLTLDAAGNVFVANERSERIRMITPTGLVTTVTNAVGNPITIGNPLGVAVDAAGTLYVSESHSYRIVKIDPAGQTSVIAGDGNPGSRDGPAAQARFSGPSGLALDGAGNLFVADYGNDTIRKIGTNGMVTTLAGQARDGDVGFADGPGPEARFNRPQAVAVDDGDNLYVADRENQVIRRINPQGEVSTLAGMPGLSGSDDGVGGLARFWWPRGVAVDGASNVFVADELNQTIRKVTPQGVVSTLAGLARQSGWSDGIGSEARFNSPYGVAVDGDGNVVVGDAWGGTIRRISPAGLVTTLAGQPGGWGWADGFGISALFNWPEGVAVDTAGNIYVADSENDTIRKVTSEGWVSTVQDDSGGWSRFSLPEGVAVDLTGNVIVADTGCSRIRNISPTGVVTTLGGSGGVTGTADGTGSEARFYWPAGVAVGKNGRLYVADTYNGTIRIGIPACADRPVVDLPLAPVGVTRQLDTAPQTADGWQWTWVRRPSNSHAELSSTTVRNPTFTPDVPDLYIFRLQTTNSVTGEVALRTLEINTLSSDAPWLMQTRQQLDGSIQFTLITQTNQPCTLETSPDLSTWQDWTNFTPVATSTLLTDPEAGQNSRRFYRARRP